MLLIDAANVIGSRPNGWWRDRPGAARAFVDQIREAVKSGRLAEPVVVVLEGAARKGVDAAAAAADDVTVIHAPGSGDETVVAIAAESGSEVVLVSADRRLIQRAKLVGAETASPQWFLDAFLS